MGKGKEHVATTHNHWLPSKCKWCTNSLVRLSAIGVEFTRQEADVGTILIGRMRDPRPASEKRMPVALFRLSARLRTLSSTRNLLGVLIPAQGKSYGSRRVFVSTLLLWVFIFTFHRQVNSCSITLQRNQWMTTSRNRYCFHPIVSSRKYQFELDQYRVTYSFEKRELEPTLNSSSFSTMERVWGSVVSPLDQPSPKPLCIIVWLKRDE